MTTEDKKKAMLADDLSVYIQDKHTQEECVGFIDGYNAALAKLDLLGVVGRSKQLQNCNCKRFEQNMDGRFYCRDCGKVEYTVL